MNYTSNSACVFILRWAIKKGGKNKETMSCFRWWIDDTWTVLHCTVLKEEDSQERRLYICTTLEGESISAMYIHYDVVVVVEKVSPYCSSSTSCCKWHSGLEEEEEEDEVAGAKKGGKKKNQQLFCPSAGLDFTFLFSDIFLVLFLFESSSARVIKSLLCR